MSILNFLSIFWDILLCLLCGEYFEILEYFEFLEYFWDILLCLLCGEGILRIPGEGVIGADRGGTGILPLRIHLLQCILGKCFAYLPLRLHLQGDFFNWSYPKNHKFFSVSKMYTL